MNSSTWCYLFVFLIVSLGSLVSGIEPIERRVPPIGIEIPPDVREQTLARLRQLDEEIAAIHKHPHRADVDVLLKAVRFAVLHREIYRPQQLALLGETLDLAQERLEKLKDGKADWQHSHLTLRGFYSEIDDSPQPYGLVIPEGLPANDPVPLYVWLHGRGDKTTDIHFIKDRLSKVGQISPPNAIVLHPFGRQCLGFKSAGETDVIEAISHVVDNYSVDPQRVVLMGFSMGGAGAWHLGAHYTDRFVAVSPGAGFAETSKYQKYTPEKISATPAYERRLWGAYDVPNYARNLFNVTVVCYSGEKDKQMQAARVMEAAFQIHGKKLEHIIGPGMGHKYHPDSLSQIMRKMDTASKNVKSVPPTTIHLQTQTLRYSRMHWLQIDRLAKHWKDTRVDTKLDQTKLIVETRNVTQLTLSPLPAESQYVVIDGTVFTIDNRSKMVFSRQAETADGKWKSGPLPSRVKLAKRPGLQGPIDDAFLHRFLVVVPSGPSRNALRDEWTRFELQHLRDRWAALFRGTLPEKNPADVTEEDIRDCNLVLFGDIAENSILERVFASLPQEFKDDAQSRMANYAGGNFVPQFIYPNPLSPDKYIVWNSGPTFRESHDRTNSLQNPKLPDWAIIDISTPPNGERPGKVASAGFFDENWQFTDE